MARGGDRRGYAHFWTGNQLTVIYDDARYELARDDPSTWEPAISHGLGQGLLREWLDFPADDTTGAPADYTEFRTPPGM